MLNWEGACLSTRTTLEVRVPILAVPETRSFDMSCPAYNLQFLCSLRMAKILETMSLLFTPLKGIANPGQVNDLQIHLMSL